MLFKYHVVITDKSVHIIYKSMQLQGKKLCPYRKERSEGYLQQNHDKRGYFDKKLLGFSSVFRLNLLAKSESLTFRVSPAQVRLHNSKENLTAINKMGDAKPEI